MSDVPPTSRSTWVVQPWFDEGDVPPPPIYRRPIRRALLTIHRVGYALWCWTDDRMDDDLPRQA